MLERRSADTPVRPLSRTPARVASPSSPLKYLFLKDLAGSDPNKKPEIRPKLLIYKYFTSKSFILKDHDQRGPSRLQPHEPGEMPILRSCPGPATWSRPHRLRPELAFADRSSAGPLSSVAGSGLECLLT